jgi:propanediol utilization protein
MSLKVPVGVSNRHIHLCADDLFTLFGEGYELHKMRELKQGGEYFAAEETLTVKGPKGSIDRVRLLAPLRDSTQVELLISDSYRLGIKLPVRDSGSRDASPTVTLIGPKGSVELSSGVMAAWRHVHIREEDAARIGLKDGDYVLARGGSCRAAILENVKIRTGDFIPELHIDVDEANALGVNDGDDLEILDS